MISDEAGLAIMNECDFDDYTFGSPHNVTDACNHAISEANDMISDYINNYDVILDVCYPSIVQQELRLRKLVNLSFPPFPTILRIILIGRNLLIDSDNGLCYCRLPKLASV